MNASYKFLTRKPCIETLIKINEIKDSIKIIDLESQIPQNQNLDTDCVSKCNIIRENLTHDEKYFIVPYEIRTHEHLGQKRHDYIIRAHLLDETIVNIDVILIKLDFQQPRSLLNIHLNDFLDRSCIRSNDSVELKLRMKSLNGNFELYWKFDIAKNVEFDCILGSDFLLDLETSPVTTIRPQERMIIISKEKIIKNLGKNYIN